MPDRDTLQRQPEEFFLRAAGIEPPSLEPLVTQKQLGNSLGWSTRQNSIDQLKQATKIVRGKTIRLNFLPAYGDVVNRNAVAELGFRLTETGATYRQFLSTRR
jgi:hypothetical protein